MKIFFSVMTICLFLVSISATATGSVTAKWELTQTVKEANVLLNFVIGSESGEYHSGFGYSGSHNKATKTGQMLLTRWTYGLMTSFALSAGLPTGKVIPICTNLADDYIVKEYNSDQDVMILIKGDPAHPKALNCSFVK